jgi:formate hydrogenlyase subunit 3/multisubunit Na+/H+ antiporter MnhD subunit
MLVRIFENLFFPKYIFERQNRLIQLYGISGKNLHNLPFIIGTIICDLVAIKYARLTLLWIFLAIFGIIALVILLIPIDKSGENKIYDITINREYKRDSINQLVGISIGLIFIILWIYSWIDLVPSDVRELFT